MEQERTWIDPEERAYPRGGFTRRARVLVRANPNAPDALPASVVGHYRMVRASIPDTYFTVPARLRVGRRTVKGFISLGSERRGELTFTPEATEGGR